MIKPKTRQISRSSLIVMGGFIISKIIGIVRQSVIARTFGASDMLDAYYAAFKLPDLLVTLVAGGAIATTFIPVFSEYIAKGDTERAWRLASAVLNVLLTSMIVIGLLAAMAAPWLVQRFIAPGFSDPQQEMTVHLMRIVLVSSILFTVSSLVMSVLQAHGHFLLPALADFFYDLGIIGGALFLVPSMGILGLSAGVVCGAFLHLMIQVPGLVHFKARYIPGWQSHQDRKLLELLKLMAPRILILGMFQFVFLFTNNLASTLEQGSITAINMGWIMMQMPEVIFAMAIATAAFPTMSQLVALRNQPELARTVSGVLGAILFLILPSTVALIMLGQAYISVLFRGSAFDQHASDMVYMATAAFTLGLLGHSVLELAARIFYAHKNTVLPFLFALGATILNITLCVILAPRLGQTGLILANSIAVTLQSGALLWLAWRSLVRFAWRPVLKLVGQSTLAAAVMAGVIGLVLSQCQTLGALHNAIIGTIVGGGAYLSIMGILNRKKLGHLRQFFPRKNKQT